MLPLLYIPWCKYVTVDFGKGWQKELETLVHADGRLFDVQVDPRDLQKTAVGGKGAERAVADSQGAVGWVGMEGYQLTVGWKGGTGEGKVGGEKGERGREGVR